MNGRTRFVCGNPKCDNSIEAEGLNSIQLKIIRCTPKTCHKCKQITKWLEQLSIFSDIETKTLKNTNGGGRAQTDIKHIH